MGSGDRKTGEVRIFLDNRIRVLTFGLIGPFFINHTEGGHAFSDWIRSSESIFTGVGGEINYI